MQPKHRLRERRIGGKIKIGTIIAIKNVEQLLYYLTQVSHPIMWVCDI